MVLPGARAQREQAAGVDRLAHAGARHRALQVQGRAGGQGLRREVHLPGRAHAVLRGLRQPGLRYIYIYIYTYIYIYIYIYMLQ